MSQTADTLKQSFLAWHKLTIPAGQDVVKSVTGMYFMISELQSGTELQFLVSIDELPFFPATLGLKFTLPPGNAFSKLRFRNPTTTDMVVEFYAGTVEGEDMRLNIVRGRATPFMHAETVISGHSSTIAAGAEVDLAGTAPSPKYIRKATIISNMDPAVDLDLLNDADEMFDVCLFRQSKLIESSDNITVKNNTAAPVVCRIAQIWYVIT